MKNKDHVELWFDVEQRYNSISPTGATAPTGLWFDVEQRYNSIREKDGLGMERCGLM